MAQTVADVMWEMLSQAGVKRCYGIVGDALNPVIDSLRRNGKVEFVHVRHEEYGVFAAVAEACLTGTPVVVCASRLRESVVPQSEASRRLFVRARRRALGRLRDGLDLQWAPAASRDELHRR